MGVLAAALLEGDDLLALALRKDLTGDRGARNQRRAMGRRIAAEHQDFADGEGRADVAGDLLDHQNVVLGPFVLLAAGADNGEHELKSLSVMHFRPDTTA